MNKETVPTLTLGALLRDALQLFGLHWQRHMVISFACALPVAVLIGLGYFDPVFEFLQAQLEVPEVERMPDGMPSMTVSGQSGADAVPMRILAMAALTLMIMSGYAAAWWWGLFELDNLPPEERRHWSAVFASVLTRFFLFGALMAAAVFAASLLAAVVTQFLYSVLRPLGLFGFARFVISAVLQLLLLGAAMRFAVALPAAVWGEDVPFLRAWSATRGRTMILGIAALALILPGMILAVFVAQLLGMTLGGGSPWIDAATALLLGPVIYLYYGLVFSGIAAAFRQLRAAEAL